MKEYTHVVRSVDRKSGKGRDVLETTEVNPNGKWLTREDVQAVLNALGVVPIPSARALDSLFEDKK